MGKMRLVEKEGSNLLKTWMIYDGKFRAMISMIFSAFCFFMILTIISQPTSASTGTYNIATTSWQEHEDLKKLPP